MTMESHQFCTSYVKEIFDKWDKDKSGVLERQELKDWLKQEIKQKPLRAKHVKKGFEELVKGSDSNRDGKVDRWELYHHCVKSYVAE